MPIAQFSPNKPYTGELVYSKKIDDFSLKENSPLVILQRFLSRDLAHI